MLDDISEQYRSYIMWQSYLEPGSNKQLADSINNNPQHWQIDQEK